MASSQRKLSRIAFACMTPVVDSHEHQGVELQSFNPELLKRMQRPYGRERFGPAIDQLSQVAANIEVQIIFGLPTDTWDGFLETLTYALSLPVTVRVYHCLVLPDALLTRGRPEWQMKFDPFTMSMQSCAGWNETELLDMRAMLSRETVLCGGTSGQFWWSFPPPAKRSSIPSLSTRQGASRRFLQANYPRLAPCGSRSWSIGTPR